MLLAQPFSHFAVAVPVLPSHLQIGAEVSDKDKQQAAKEDRKAKKQKESEAIANQVFALAKLMASPPGMPFFLVVDRNVVCAACVSVSYLFVLRLVSRPRLLACSDVLLLTFLCHTNCLCPMLFLWLRFTIGQFVLRLVTR